ncbi:MAG: class I SAM-dependent methyltransferase [Phototrophicaceae bacterium]
MMNLNRWNRWRYTLYAPLYDWITQSFAVSRQRSITLLELSAGEKLLIVGAGTGEDLPFIPAGVNVLATDLTPAMVARMQQKAQHLPCQVEARVMDGQALNLPDATFDAVILHLILAVIPDPYACIREVNRVLKPGGRVVIYDKFLPADAKLTWIRRALNLLTSIAFSDINRKREEIVASVALRLLHEEPATYQRLGYSIALYEKS